MANWLAPLKPTKLEVYVRTPYQDMRRDEKARYYQENKDAILARVRSRRAAARQERA